MKLGPLHPRKRERHIALSCVDCDFTQICSGSLRRRMASLSPTPVESRLNADGWLRNRLEEIFLWRKGGWVGGVFCCARCDVPVGLQS